MEERTEPAVWTKCTAEVDRRYRRAKRGKGGDEERRSSGGETDCPVPSFIPFVG